MRPGTSRVPWTLSWGILLCAAGSASSTSSGDSVPDGVCWALNREEPGCSQVIQVDVSRAECCASGSTNYAWSNSNHTLTQLSLANYLGELSCKPCKDSCDSVRCGPHEECRMLKGFPTCVCAPNCTGLQANVSVCASDGNTYRDECELLHTQQCRGHSEVQLMYRSSCQVSCENVVCEPPLSCLTDVSGRAYCVTCGRRPCPIPTVPGHEVCGKNNVTYLSPCHLRRATCLLGRSIGIRHQGRCREQSREPTARKPPIPGEPTSTVF
ncbi:follistatin-related protein 3 isoform X1 [Dipodomys merriami]|uniref:follistatin-related protein 3 isoform X1 n=1 Tax=Dipodomys merriami TaxID=94247 RepID=UPI0038560007